MILEVSWDGLWTLSFGLSQFHGRGSWVVCEPILSICITLVGVCVVLPFCILHTTHHFNVSLNLFGIMGYNGGVTTSPPLPCFQLCTDWVWLYFKFDHENSWFEDIYR